VRSMFDPGSSEIALRTHCATIGKSGSRSDGYQRRERRGPIVAPTAVLIAIPSVYQTRTKPRPILFAGEGIHGRGRCRPTRARARAPVARRRKGPPVDGSPSMRPRIWAPLGSRYGAGHRCQLDPNQSDMGSASDRRRRLQHGRARRGGSTGKTKSVPRSGNEAFRAGASAISIEPAIARERKGYSMPSSPEGPP